MATEYLVVRFSKKRSVLVNGEMMGMTNTKLELEGGAYEITLGPPQDFQPALKSIDLTGTSSLDPMTVTFKKIRS